MILIPLLALLSCGESKEEKQKRLSDQLNHNIDSIAKADKNRVDSLIKLQVDEIIKRVNARKDEAYFYEVLKPQWDSILKANDERYEKGRVFPYF